MKYQKTLTITDFGALSTVKPGQWVDINGLRGQFLGHSTRTGQYFFRLQGAQKWGAPSDCLATHYMRQAALCEGAK